MCALSRRKSQDSPTVMDSGRPGVGGALVTIMGSVGGLESILKHIKITIIIIIFHLQFNWFSAFMKLIVLTAHLNVSDAPLSQSTPGCSELDWAGKAAESSTELTEATCKRK